MQDFYQGDIIKISGYKALFLVVSKNAFIRAEKMFHVCPIVHTDTVNPVHIEINTKDGTSRTIMCEEIKLIDPLARNCSKVDSIDYGTKINISDVIQSLFEYD